MNTTAFSTNENIHINTDENQLDNLSSEKILQPAVTEQKYRQIEYDPAQIKNQNLSKASHSSHDTTNVYQSLDPIQQVKSMISAGYSPTLGLLRNASHLLKSKKIDLSDTFFAILLHKLIKMSQKK